MKTFPQTRDFPVLDQTFKSSLLPWIKTFLPGTLDPVVSPFSVSSADDRPFQGRQDGPGSFFPSHLERMASGVGIPSLQHPRPEAHSPFPAPLCSNPQEQICDHVGHHSNLLHSPTRFLQVSSPHGSNPLHSTFSFQNNITLIPIHISGKLNVLVDQGSRFFPSPEGVVPGPPLLQVAVADGTGSGDSHSTGGPARHLLQLSAGEFHLSSPRPSGIGSQCLVPGLKHLDINLFPPVTLRTGSFPYSGSTEAKEFWPHLPCHSGWFQALTSRCPVQVPLLVNHSLSQVTSRGSEYHRYPQALHLLAWIL